MPYVVFNPGDGDTEGADLSIIDDAQLSVTVPAVTKSGDVAVAWSNGAVLSNLVPFELIP
jgi:hypothetical protein